MDPTTLTPSKPQTSPAGHRARGLEGHHTEKSSSDSPAYVDQRVIVFSTPRESGFPSKDALITTKTPGSFTVLPKQASLAS